MLPCPHVRRSAVAVVVFAFICCAAQAQLRVATWNISNYSGGLVTQVQTAVYAVFEGRSFAPDVILAQEFTSAAALTTFVDALNDAPGSPGTWTAAPWVSGPNTVNVCAYRGDKVTLIESPTIVSQGGNPPNPPTNAMRFTFRLNGYESGGAVIVCYSSHMKSGNTSEDLARRLLEAQRLRDDAEALDPEYCFVLGGDLNIRASDEAAYQELVGSQANDAGRFYDPIATPGTWRDNYLMRFVHTQDPVASNGGMDDRFDQLLVSGDLVDGSGFDYLGDPALPYSTTTWDDANHSYRSWGNDGTSYNTGLTVTGNTMVGATIAQALIACAGSGGHLPVFLDLRVPPAVGSDVTIDFGQVPQGAVAEQTLAVWNAGDVTLWTAGGIGALHYALEATSGFTAPDGAFVHAAGAVPNEHTITMDTAAVGPLTGTLTISSDAPNQPTRIVMLLGEVTAASWPIGDMNCDGAVDLVDINPFVLALTAPAQYELRFPDCALLNADVNQNGAIDLGDINPFVALLTSGA